jgi:hypothetical protein
MIKRQALEFGERVLVRIMTGKVREWVQKAELFTVTGTAQPLKYIDDRFDELIKRDSIFSSMFHIKIERRKFDLHARLQEFTLADEEHLRSGIA